MLENLTLLAIIIIVFWLGALAYYYITSQKQQSIRADLERLRRKLEEVEAQDEES